MLSYVLAFLGSVNIAFFEVLENLLQQVAVALKLFLEAIAIFIIAIAVFQKAIEFFKKMELVKNRQNRELIRLDLALSLALALEFLLASDIVGTAISPGWDAILQLVVITGIRTFLNFFLQKELTQLKKRNE